MDVKKQRTWRQYMNRYVFRSWSSAITSLTSDRLLQICRRGGFNRFVYTNDLPIEFSETLPRQTSRQDQVILRDLRSFQLLPFHSQMSRVSLHDVRSCYFRTIRLACITSGITPCASARFWGMCAD